MDRGKDQPAICNANDRKKVYSNEQQRADKVEQRRAKISPAKGTWHALENCGATCTCRLSLARTPHQGSSVDFSIHELLLDIN